jgi:acetolactate decarboxylase
MPTLFLHTASRFGFSTILTLVYLYSLPSKAQSSTKPSVHIAGAMKNVMWKGALKGIIDVDTIRPRENLNGIGPLEYLKGEILLLDGKSYLSKVRGRNQMKVEESFQAKAPFFVYSWVETWKVQPLPDSVRTIKQLEHYLYRITTASNRPFAFKLSGKVHTAKIHVVNLPDGTPVKEPDDAHQGQIDFNLKNRTVDIIGFFSTAHQSIFTHHDSFLHLHLITANRKMMGHLDKVQFKKGMQLFLPAEE